MNDGDVENQAPINHIDDYMKDYMMDKNKEFDEKLLDESFTSLKEAYRTLALESTKKHNGNVIRQFRKVRTAFHTHVVCVTDKDVHSLADCKCSYRAVIKKKRKKDDNNWNYIEKEGRNLKHIGQCLRNSATYPGKNTKLETETSCQSSIPMSPLRSLSRTRTVT